MLIHCDESAHVLVSSRVKASSGDYLRTSSQGDGHGHHIAAEDWQPMGLIVVQGNGKVLWVEQ